MVNSYGNTCQCRFYTLRLLCAATKSFLIDKEDDDGDDDETKERKMSQDELVKGALESAFWAMDRLILRDKQHYRISGGSCVMVALFIFGKLYLANAGDTRSCCYLPKVDI